MDGSRSWPGRDVGWNRSIREGYDGDEVISSSIEYPVRSIRELCTYMHAKAYLERRFTGPHHESRRLQPLAVRMVAAHMPWERAPLFRYPQVPCTCGDSTTKELKP